MPPSKLLDLMARKEKVKHGQNAARLRDVATSKAQVDEMDGKLTSLLEGCETSMPTQINVSRLRASHWLAGQLAQQIEVNRTKGQQLEAAMTEARTALQQFDPLWVELFPAEQARIVALVVERVDIGEGGLNVRLRIDGLSGLAREMLARGIEAAA